MSGNLNKQKTIKSTGSIATPIKQETKPVEITNSLVENFDQEFEESWAKPEPIVEKVNVIATAIDNIDDEFADTWDDKEVQPTIEPTIEPTIKPTMEVNVSSASENNADEVDTSGDMTEEDISSENNKRLIQGNLILNRLKKEGFEVEGITGDMIISNWEEILLTKTLNKTHVKRVIAAVRAHGFETPRNIQMMSILRIVLGGDLIAQASAGNGKTGAFGIGAILSTDPTLKAIQKIIVVPTTLLSDQIFAVMNELSRGTGIVIQNWRGGGIYYRDRNPHIVVGTPGRIVDLIYSTTRKDGSERPSIDLNRLTSLILDEGDDLLGENFCNQIRDIVVKCPSVAQVCLFSATLPSRVINFCKNPDFMTNPSLLIVPEKKVITTRVNQYYSKCIDVNDKINKVINCITKNPNATVIIFCNTCSGIKGLSEGMQNRAPHIRHICITGKMPSVDKTLAIKNFLDGKCKILLSSDIGARGFDCTDVSIVINYDMPHIYDTYVHRIGRAGRAGDVGNAVTLTMSEEELSRMKAIVQLHGMPIRETANKKMKDGTTKVEFEFA